MLVATLVVTAVSWTALRDAPYVAPTPDDPSPHPVAAEAARTLDLLAAAVNEGDRDAASALAPSGDDEARALLADIVDNAHDLRLEELSLRYVGEDGGVSAAGAWPAAVEATWQLPEDDAPSRTELQVGLVTAGAQVGIRSFGGAGRTPVWLTGPVTVRRAPGVLVVDRADDAERMLSLAAAAVPVVRRVLPDWTPRLVVEVPATAAALDDALGADEGTYADVAAVTASADGSSGRGAPVHVYINPQVFARLSAIGAKVVMSHEAAHVAAGAARSDLPLWLLEGFADYVALRDVDLPLRTTAAQVVAEVRRDGPPADLPADQAFDPAGARLGAAYEAAWLACVVIAETSGERALVDLYRAVDRGIPLDEALQDTAGFGERALVRRWQERLSDLAG